MTATLSSNPTAMIADRLIREGNARLRVSYVPNEYLVSYIYDIGLPEIWALSSSIPPSLLSECVYDYLQARMLDYNESTAFEGWLFINESGDLEELEVC